MARFSLGLTPVLSVLPLAGAATPPFMPWPVRFQMERGTGLTIDGSLRIATAFPDARVAAAAGRLSDRIARQTGIAAIGEGMVKLNVACSAAGPEYPTLGENES